MKLQELRLSNVLMSSQFTFDTHSTKQLILSGVVFVNGNNVRNANFNTFVGDFIQLVVNLRYYVIYR
jgi:ribosomal protein S4